MATYVDDQILEAQDELENYGDHDEAGGLIKALRAAAETIIKGRKGPPVVTDPKDNHAPPTAETEPQDEEEPAGKPGVHDDDAQDPGGQRGNMPTPSKPQAKNMKQRPTSDSGDDEDDEVMDDDDGEDNEDDDEYETPKGKKTAPFRGATSTRSRKSGDSQPIQRRDDTADTAFLKSLLIGDDGQPTAEAEVIEVSDVLMKLTDTFAKSLGSMEMEIGQAQLQGEATHELSKAMATAILALSQQTDQLIKRLDALDATPGAVPFSGLTANISKSLPTPDRALPGATAPLRKSLVGEQIQAAFTTGLIDREVYARASATLDTPSGIEGALKYLPESLRLAITENVTK